MQSNKKALVEFAHKYFSGGLKILVPEDREVFETDDATSHCLYRSGQFQVEIYLIHKQPFIPTHEHPYVENIEFSLRNDFSVSEKNLERYYQGAGQTHGTGIRDLANERGFMLISVQRWADGLTPTTISSQWKGYTAGEKHRSLIRRFHPNCLIRPDGYADVTLKAEDAVN